MDFISLFNEQTLAVACLVALGCFYVYKDKQQQENTDKMVQGIREDSEKDKERLYSEINHNREVNKELLETNRLYAVDIKTDLQAIKSKLTIES